MPGRATPHGGTLGVGLRAWDPSYPDPPRDTKIPNTTTYIHNSPPDPTESASRNPGRHNCYRRYRRKDALTNVKHPQK